MAACSLLRHGGGAPFMHEIRCVLVGLVAGVAVGKEKKGFTQMHADQTDVLGFGLNRYWLTFDPVALSARYLHC